VTAERDALRYDRDVLREAASEFLTAQADLAVAQGEYAAAEKGEASPAVRFHRMRLRAALATEDAALAALRTLLPTVPA
jgi:hypothetical protein